MTWARNVCGAPNPLPMPHTNQTFFLSGGLDRPAMVPARIYTILTDCRRRNAIASIPSTPDPKVHTAAGSGTGVGA